MTIDEVKLPDKRFESSDIKDDIQSYGSDNLYPQKISRLIKASTNASSCARTYAKFIRGRGFSDTEFYKSKVNFKGQTCDTLLRFVSNDIARFAGFYLHINYNIFGEVVSVSHVPFEDCRLGCEDDNGYVSKIAVSQNWEKKKRKYRKRTKDSTNVDYIDVFNPNVEVIQAQIFASGGIESYNGQMLFVSMDGDMIYPTPIYDSAITDISTDEGLSNVRFRNVRNNFLPSGMYVYTKGTKFNNTGKIPGQEQQPAKNGFDPAKLVAWQGDKNACKVIAVGIDPGETEPRFVEFPTKNFDKDFEVTRTSVAEEIYAAFNQDVFHRLRSGSFGFSQDNISQSFNYYNSLTDDERIMVESAFKSVFELFHKPINPTQDYSIMPLQYAV